ncbi:MAG: transketolase [Alphaproteobacteria bacterium]|nr:transketolase [Alphaproteobacteria bacterium]
MTMLQRDHVPNKDLRRQIVDMCVSGQNGHIPSAFSILDIIIVLYRDVLKFDAKDPLWDERDYFILSKGHGCLALYVNLHRHHFITDNDVRLFCKKGGILGEHPDRTKVPGVEASTGSLGHGLSFALGIHLGLRIQNKRNRIFVLVGDGECHEGTVWEAANIARNRKLGNLCVIVDWNQSAMQLMPFDDMPAKWAAFGWNVQVVDGHNEKEIQAAIANVAFVNDGIPHVIVAKTIKGFGIPMIEGHGKWHHRIPDANEHKQLMEALA